MYSCIKCHCNLGDQRFSRQAMVRLALQALPLRLNVTVRINVESDNVYKKEHIFVTLYCESKTILFNYYCGFHLMRFTSF